MMSPARGTPRLMTWAEALRRAREIWGAQGDAELRRRAPPGQRCVVGTKGAAREFTAIGYGDTFEEAFADAGKEPRRP